MIKNYEEMNSIELLIDEIEKALNNELYLVALMTALTIPDALSSIKYGKGGGDNYVKWFDEYVKNCFDVPYGYLPKLNNNSVDNLNEKALSEEEKYLNSPSYLCGDTCYQLRCNLLHDLDNRIVGGKGKNREYLNIEECVLQFSKDEFVHGSNSGVEMIPEVSKDGEWCMRVNKYCYISVRELCNNIVRAAKEFIKSENVSNKLPKLKINTGGGKTFEMYDTIKNIPDITKIKRIC